MTLGEAHEHHFRSCNGSNHLLFSAGWVSRTPATKGQFSEISAPNENTHNYNLVTFPLHLTPPLTNITVQRLLSAAISIFYLALRYISI
jgi:hypothetical protein